MKHLPPRIKVNPADTWDLSSLFCDDAAWEKAFTKWEKRIAGYAEFQGTLGQSAERLAECLKFDCDFDRAGERLGSYAFLKTAEDTAESTYQRMHLRYVNAASRAGQAASFIRPEILAIPAAKIKQFLAADVTRPRIASCSNGWSATSRTRWARRKRSCWPCRPKWPRPPGRSSAN